MNPMFFFLIAAVVLSANAASSSSGEPAKLNDAIIAKYGETPCLNKVIGQRLTHPTNSHKFLRCMSLESLWIETCPDGLFYNPSMEICDWSTKPRPTTRITEVVKNRPVLFKTRNNEGIVVDNVVDTKTSPIEKTISTSVVRDEQVVDETTPSLLEELRQKLNLDSTEKPKTRKFEKIMKQEEDKVAMDEVAMDEVTKRPSLKLVEVPAPAETGSIDTDFVTRTKKPSLKLVEVPAPAETGSIDSDFVVQTKKPKSVRDSLSF